MRRTEKRSVTSEREYTVEVRCDLCGAVAPQPDRDESEWGKGQSESVGVTIKLREGTAYYGDVAGEVVFFDICPDCFRNRLMPWLDQQGAKPQEYDY